jgi:succinyl-diaminopimelate desuccinylase
MDLPVISFSQKLIQIPSLSGKNEEIITFLANYLHNLGFANNILEYEGDNSYLVNNLHAVFNPNNQKKILYFAGHSDVVAPGELKNWSYPPFLASINNGRLYGRGAVDMKCAIACFIVAVEELLKEGKELNFGIGLLITNDEEADGVNGTKKVLQWMQQNNHKISACIVGEPTNPDKFGEMIKVGRRGSINFFIKINGKQGHVAYPQNADNPITTLVNLLKLLKDHKLDLGNKYFDPSNLEITHISSLNLGNNVIPSEAQANFNIRFNDLHSSQEIIDFIDYACKKSCQNLSSDNLGYQLSYKTSGEAFLSKPQELAEITKQVIKKITGREPILSTTGGTSDARFIKDYCQVIECGLVNKTAHQIDEYAKISEIIQLKDTYLEILRKFNAK